MARTTTYVKDPDSTLDFLFDFAARTNGNGRSDYLASGETITEQTVTADEGLEVDSSSIVLDDTAVSVWLSGGTDGTIYTVTCNIATSAGRSDQRTIKVLVSER